MRKKIVILVAALFLMSALGGCGGGDPANESNPVDSESVSESAENNTTAAQDTQSTGKTAESTSSADRGESAETTQRAGEPAESTSSAAQSETGETAQEQTSAEPETTAGASQGQTSAAPEETAATDPGTTSSAPEKTTGPSVPAVTDPNRDWEPVKTKFGTFCFPDQWFDFLETEQTEINGGVAVLFRAVINGKRIDLYELTVKSGSGGDGTLTGPDGVKRGVFVRMCDLPDLKAAGFSEGEINRVYAMQESVNNVLDNLS